MLRLVGATPPLLRGRGTEKFHRASRVGQSIRADDILKKQKWNVGKAQIQQIRQLMTAGVVRILHQRPVAST